MVATQRESDITGAILAGGKSSRMGRDKALLELNGVPFIQYIADTLQEVFTSVILIANDEEKYDFLGLTRHLDMFMDCGPLGGIHAALKNAATEDVFITSCDVPFLSSSLITYVVKNHRRGSVTILCRDQAPQPLCGVYHEASLPVIEDRLKTGQFSVRQCLQHLRTTNLPLASDMAPGLLDIDTPTEYRQALLHSRHRIQGSPV